ncbi:hypothetical protein AAFC00_004916 [Neodothiora populina]|uniref:Zn(2)-C6 fungal-type domain-containing protein n=1 Tax=Neodothiora populina TaxID=2781224 RepID=A0ABR3P3M0_9PEZI
MPPRLNHRKSRTGCTTCKQRKIKCDERKPDCTACLRHRVKCTYDISLPPRRDKIAANSSSRGSTDASPNLVDSVTADPNGSHEANLLDISGLQRKQLELFLLHRFISAVSLTFPAAEDPELRYLYPRDAVELSFSFPFLQNTILAITALHTAVLRLSPQLNQDEDEAPSTKLPAAFQGMDFAQIHRFYLNLALHQQRTELASISNDNGEALTLASVMLAMIANRLLSPIDSEHSRENSYSPPIQALYISQATGPIIQAAMPYISDQTHLSRMIRWGRDKFSVVFSDTRPDGTSTALGLSVKPPFSQLLEFEDAAEAEDSDSDTVAAYAKTVTYVNELHSGVLRGDSSRELCRSAMAFAPVVPRRFIGLLAEERPRALAIYAHYMALVKRVEQYWWFAGAAEREVFGVNSIMPDSWRWAMAWPLEMISRFDTANAA